MIELKSNIKGMGSYIIKFFDCVNKQNNQQKGLSHLLEHCMCQPIKQYDNIFKENGINWNACTDNSDISFYITGLSKNVKKYIDKFKDCILNYTITKQVFQRQKKIVISEYKQYLSDPSTCFIINWFRKYYNTTFSIGLYEVLENITYEQFIKFKNKVFNNNYKTYFIHYKGNKDIRLPKQQKKEYKFNKDGYKDFPIETKFLPKEIKEITVMISNVIHFNQKDYIKKRVLMNLLNLFLHNGLTSYLYQEIRQKTGHVYSIGHDDFISKNQSVILYTFNIDKKYINEIKHRIEEAMYDIQKHITKKIFKSLIKQYLIIKTVNKNLNYSNLSEFNQNDFKALDMIKNKEITFEDFKQFIIDFEDNYLIYTDQEENKQ